MSVVLCDGCGAPADADHLRRRIERLELATRFRPIHIGTLFLGEAPPPRAEDYFYRPAVDRAGRGEAARALFDELVAGAGISPDEVKDEETALAEFQRRGYFFADCVECPLEEVLPPANRLDLADLAVRFGSTLIKRLEHSYKPRQIALLSAATRKLIPLLEEAGWGERLLLVRGAPLNVPRPGDPAAREEFRADLAALLSRATVVKSA